MDSSQLRFLSRHAVRLLGMLNAQCEGIGLSPVQCHALTEIQLGPLSINALAQLLQLNKSNASRAVDVLLEQKLCVSSVNPKDKRGLLIMITPEGEKVCQQLDMQQADFYRRVLAHVSETEKQQMQQGLAIFLKGLAGTVAADQVTLRPLVRSDNQAIAGVIREVSKEHGLSAEKGYGVADLSLEDMYAAYEGDGRAYWVLEYQGVLVGGAGIAGLDGVENTCELQKMYFLASVRGQGLAKRLLQVCLQQAKQWGYQQCYLETTASLEAATGLYQSSGFVFIDQVLGNTGHDACEVRMLKPLH